MKPRDHDPAFLRRLRFAARDRIVRQRIRRLRRSWRHQNLRLGPVLFSAVPLLALTACAGPGVERLGLTRAGRDALWAYALCFPLFALKNSIQARLGYWPDVYAALRLPVSNDWLVRRQWARGIRVTPLLAAIVFAAASMMAWTADAVGPGWLGALPFALLFVAMAVPASTWLAATPWGGRLEVALWTPLVGAWIGGAAFPSVRTAGVAFLNSAGDWIAWILPTGWVARPFLHWLEGGPGLEVLALLPAALLALSVRRAVRCLVNRVRPLDWGLVRWFSQPPEEASLEMQEALDSMLGEKPARTAEDARLTILSRKFLEPSESPEKAGWIERFLWRQWTPRERFLAEIAFSGLPPWSARYLKLAALLGVWVLLGCLAGPLDIAWLRWSWLLTALTLALGLTPAVAPLGRLEAFCGLGHGSVKFLAILPVSLPEVARWTLRTTALRTILGMPLAMACGAAFGKWGGMGPSPRDGVLMIVAAVVVLSGFQAIWVVNQGLGRLWFRLHVGRFGWLRGLVTLALFILWCVFALLALLTMATGHPGLGIALALGATICGWAVLLHTCRQWRRGGLEWLIPPEMQTE